MRLMVANGLLVVLMLTLLGIAVKREITPAPRVGVPCICPYKSAILCAIYCGG